jgi:hypothetical protein
MLILRYYRSRRCIQGVEDRKGPREADRPDFRFPGFDMNVHFCATFNPFRIFKRKRNRRLNGRDLRRLCLLRFIRHLNSAV